MPRYLIVRSDPRARRRARPRPRPGPPQDLSAPEFVYQLEIDGLACDFPLLQTLEAAMKNHAVSAHVVRRSITRVSRLSHARRPLTMQLRSDCGLARAVRTS